MRLLTLAVVALLLLGTALAYFTYFSLGEAQIGSLVPQDFHFGVFYRSANQLQELYERLYARKDFDPVRTRIGRRINVADLNGYDYDAPAGYFLSRDRNEIFVVPCEDFGAFTDAFDTNKDNLNLKSPHKAARNYLSLSASNEEAHIGRDNALVTGAASYPMALAGRPTSATMVRLMLSYLLAFDGERKRPGVPLLSREAARLPDAAAGLVAEECEDWIIGFRRPEEEKLSGLVEIVATPKEGGLLRRAAGLADEIDPMKLLAAFPRDTLILAGAVLDDAGWKRAGLPLPVGDGAFAAGIVVKQYHARRFNLLLAARPRDPAALGALARGAERLVDAGPFKSVADGEAEVRTARLETEPGWPLLRCGSKEPPPVYLSMAVEKGTWLCSIGSQAENTVRMALGCLRGARELSVFGTQRAAHTGQVSAVSHLADARGLVAVAMLTAEGMRAFEYPMPDFDIAAIGRPAALTFTLDVARKARGELRLFR